MFLLRSNPNRSFQSFWATLLLVCLAVGQASAENVVLYLKSGDRITGFVVSEYTNHVVLSNTWVKDLSVPLNEIARREIATAGSTNSLAGTNGVARPKSRFATLPPQPLFKHWKTEAEVGLDLVYSTSDQKTYHGRFKLSYELPYKSNTNNFFRNTLDYSLEYGKTDQSVQGTNQTTTSSDRMGATDKTSFDFDGHWYAYNLAGAGFDRVQKIDLQVEEGPGLGYHLLRQTNMSANVESGVDYQIQYTTDGTRKRDFFYRLAEDFMLKLNDRTTFTEKVEFFPRVNFAEYRLRDEATLSYNIWRYVYMNLTVRDSYDTFPAAGASSNELEVHSALGVKF